MKDQINTIREALLDARSLLHDGRRQDKALTALDQIEKMVGSQVPVAWGMQHTDGAILDVISPEEHAREEGGYVVPLYRAAPVAQQPKCVCGQPTSLGVVHRADGPCFVYEAQQPQAEAVPVVDRVYEAAKRLVDHADFQLGGVLSAKSKARDIPSNAASKVKARHLASLRDALAKTPQQAEAVPPGYVLVPVEPTEAMLRRGAPENSPYGINYAEACYRAMIAAAIAQQKGGA